MGWVPGAAFPAPRSPPQPPRQLPPWQPDSPAQSWEGTEAGLLLTWVTCILGHFSCRAPPWRFPTSHLKGHCCSSEVQLGPQFHPVFIHPFTVSAPLPRASAVRYPEIGQLGQLSSWGTPPPPSLGEAGQPQLLTPPTPPSTLCHKKLLHL